MRNFWLITLILYTDHLLNQSIINMLWLIKLSNWTILIMAISWFKLVL